MASRECIFNECFHPNPTPNHKSDYHNKSSIVVYDEEDETRKFCLTFKRILIGDDPYYGNMVCLCGYHKLNISTFRSHLAKGKPCQQVRDAFTKAKNKALTQNPHAYYTVDVKPKPPPEAPSSTSSTSSKMKRPSDDTETSSSNRRLKPNMEYGQLPQASESARSLMNDLADKVVKAVNERIDKEVKKLDKQMDKQVDKLNKLNKRLDKMEKNLGNIGSCAVTEIMILKRELRDFAASARGEERDIVSVSSDHGTPEFV